MVYRRSSNTKATDRITEFFREVDGYHEIHIEGLDVVFGRIRNNV